MDTRITVAEEHPTPRWYHKVGNFLLWAMPIANALCDTAVMAMAVKDMEEDNHDPVKFYLILSAISVFTFVQSTALNGRSTVNSFKETVNIVKDKKIPHNEAWPALSIRQERIAASLAGTLTLFAATCDFAAGFYYVSKAPEDYSFDADPKSWLILSLCVGSISSFTTIFTEGITTYKTVRIHLAGEKTAYLSNASKWCARLVGYPIATLGALENMVEAYAAMRTTFDAQTLPTKYIVAATCLPKGITDFCFSGHITIQAINHFVAKMLAGKPKASEVIALTLSASAAIFVIYPQRALTTALLTDPTTSLPFNSPEFLTIALSYGITARDSIVQTFTLYELFHRAVLNVLAPCATLPSELEATLLTAEDDQVSASHEHHIIDIPPTPRITHAINSSPHSARFFQSPSASSSPQSSERSRPSPLTP